MSATGNGESSAPGPLEAVTAEIEAQATSEEHQMGPFKAPESVMVAGIVEQEGFIPGWMIWWIAGAIVLAALCWIGMHGY